MAGKNILIIDDEDYIRDLLVDMLTLEGFFCNSAATTDQALQLLAQAENAYSLILLDRHLENHSSDAFLTWAREQPDLPPVVLLTGDHDIGADEARQLGARDIFYKPFQINGLLTRIKELLEQS